MTSCTFCNVAHFQRTNANGMQRKRRKESECKKTIVALKNCSYFKQKRRVRSKFLLIRKEFSSILRRLVTELGATGACWAGDVCRDSPLEAQATEYKKLFMKAQGGCGFAYLDNSINLAIIELAWLDL